MSVYINKMKSNLFFPWVHHFYLYNSFGVWLFSKKNADIIYGGKNNLEVKKVKESYLKLVNVTLKQYQKRWK